MGLTRCSGERSAELPVDQASDETGKAVRLDIVGQSSKPCSPTAMPFTPTRPPAENTAEKQRVQQQMLARNWHDDAISSELGSFCQKPHLIAGLIYLS